jgi:hypothetical protein
VDLQGDEHVLDHVRGVVPQARPRHEAEDGALVDAHDVVDGRARDVGRHGSLQYCHAHSLDGGTTWIDHPPTTDTALAISGLPVGTWVSFRFRTLKKGAYGDWSQVLKSLIH